LGDLEGRLEFLVKPPCLIFEDDHLLVLNKPAGLNTHGPSPFAGEGLYEWLRHREPRWASLAIIHRLDKDTSGLILFTKTPLANRALTEQFTRRSVRKKYVLLTDRAVPSKSFEVKSSLVRVGDRYQSRPGSIGAEQAQTRFTVLGKQGTHQLGPGTLVQAEPLTGRTHQIRVQAAEKGFPILGDSLYGGSPAARLCLHATELTIQHPFSGKELTFQAPPSFLSDPVSALRQAVIDQASSTTYRLVHGSSDRWPGWYVDRLGSYLLSQGAKPNTQAQKTKLAELAQLVHATAAYHKQLSTSPCKRNHEESSPQLEFGEPAPKRFSILENGLHFDLSFAEGYSVGIFLDQRDNRRRLLDRHIAAGFPLFEDTPQDSVPEMLNTFAYTCGFSVCAARAGLRTTSLDLSKKYLEWGQRNFRANQIDPASHDFIFGDVFDWLGRFRKKGRQFDIVLVDPPTFSRSKESGVFRVEKDYSKLIAATLPLLKSRGILFASCNSANWPVEDFLEAVRTPIRDIGRGILQEHFCPQPPDFPISRTEPAYLKTVWLRVR
jgi:23S rRNA (cytosine1962-C5)-methyltransferase